MSIHTHTHTHTHTLTHTLTYTHIYVYMYTRTYIHINRQALPRRVDRDARGSWTQDVRGEFMQGRHLLRLSHDIQLHQGTLYYTPPRDCLQYRCTPICIFLNLCVYTYVYLPSYVPANARILYYTPPRDCLQWRCTPICIYLNLCVYTCIYPSSYTSSNARTLYCTPSRDCLQCLQYRCIPI